MSLLRYVIWCSVLAWQISACGTGNIVVSKYNGNRSAASSYCSTYLESAPATTIVTIMGATVEETVTRTIISGSTTVTTTPVVTAAKTSTRYKTRTSEVYTSTTTSTTQTTSYYSFVCGNAARQRQARPAASTSYPPKRISSACSCLEESSPSTTTSYTDITIYTTSTTTQYVASKTSVITAHTSTQTLTVHATRTVTITTVSTSKVAASTVSTSTVAPSAKPTSFTIQNITPGEGDASTDAWQVFPSKGDLSLQYQGTVFTLNSNGTLQDAGYPSLACMAYNANPTYIRFENPVSDPSLELTCRIDACNLLHCKQNVAGAKEYPFEYCAYAVDFGAPYTVFPGSPATGCPPTTFQVVQA